MNIGSITSVAQSALGSVTKARELMSYNPLASGLVFPPQVSMGLAVAGTVGGLVGIDVPNEQELLALATGELDKILGGISSPISATLDDVEGILNTVAGISNSDAAKTLGGLSTAEVLQKIEWLL